MAYRRLSMSPGEALQTEIPEARRMENYRSGNCLLSYFDPNTKKFRNFTASQFGDVWNHFDQDVPEVSHTVAKQPSNDNLTLINS
ncbi:unnamed protein product [Schistosoma margrebowiei]|uniref:Uncharacterized protein n=1 Tax=Schistosoma margrebowiei TaxID=48269 RepID=A0A183MG66_9TREM|nr:unnamed protein product [Schistosoma margrebowiei]